jgi:hypothetical protein
MKKVRCWQIALMAVIIAPAIMISSAWAGKKESPNIQTAEVSPGDPGSYSIVISGENFLCDNEDETELWLGGHKLDLANAITAEQQITFTTPVEITGPGTYLMTPGFKL